MSSPPAQTFSVFCSDDSGSPLGSWSSDDEDGVGEGAADGEADEAVARLVDDGSKDSLGPGCEVG